MIHTNKVILGISAYYHDSAAALLIDGEITAAAQEERFTRRKHDSGFPRNAVDFVLSEGGVNPSDDLVLAFYDKPLLKFERLLETYHSYAPRGLKSFLTSMPVWVREKLFTRRLLREGLAEFGHEDARILFPEHHLSHAASAFYPSPFDEAAILTLDGVGEWATATLAHGDGDEITVLRELEFPHSLGLLYSAFTDYCGFRVNSGEYKLMGLAPYGDPESSFTQRAEELILREMVDLREDGSFLLNMAYFDYPARLRMCREERWEPLFGVPRRTPESEPTQPYMDLALAIQRVTEKIVRHMAETARRLTDSSHLVLAGGVALNCVSNGELLRRGIFEDIWIQPASGDAGGALGAALAAWHIGLENGRKPTGGSDAMKGSYLGPDFDSGRVRKLSRRLKAPCEEFDDFDSLCSRVASLLDRGNVVGWFQGRMEFGPRALGNRSILGDPRRPDMQKKLNLKIKYREGFRPFAPSVLAEETGDYFDLDRPSPYMLLVAPLKEKHRIPLPADYLQKSLYEKLYAPRSNLPAVTHVDYSARIQTVHRQTNERYWRLLSAFKERTGVGVLVNTSFNVRGEPIVCTPEEAYSCFMQTEMDYLVIGDCLFEKNKQKRGEKGNGNRFALD